MRREKQQARLGSLPSLHSNHLISRFWTSLRFSMNRWHENIPQLIALDKLNHSNYEIDECLPFNLIVHSDCHLQVAETKNKPELPSICELKPAKLMKSTSRKMEYDFKISRGRERSVARGPLGLEANILDWMKDEMPYNGLRMKLSDDAKCSTY